MADNILESYLVRLGAQTDANSFNKFNATLKDSGKVFGDFSFGTIANFGKMEVAIVGMFAAVGAGLIGLADKTAMADQSYRLMGLRMLMGKDSARAMSMATDELGASLDEIAYDPELNRRFQALYEQNIKLGKSLGSTFDGNMIGIRDIRMEYKRFETELDILTAGSVSKLFEKLNLGSGDAVNQLDKLNDWFSTNIPTMADSVATHLVPVWNDFKVTTKDTGSSLRTAGGDFTYLSGILLGDKSIQSTTFNVNNLMISLDDWADKLTNVSLKFQLLGRIGMHAVTGVAAALAGAHAQATDSKAAEPFKKQAKEDSDALIHDLHGLFDAKYRTGEDFAGFRAHADEVRNRNTKEATPYWAQPFPGTSEEDSSIASTAAKLAQKVSADTGLPADLIFAQWEFETGKFTNSQTKNLNNMGGIKVPGTNVFKQFESLDQYADAYEKIITSSRYVNNGIRDANTPEQWAHALKTPSGTYYGTDSEKDYAAGIRKYQPDIRDYQAYSQGAPVAVTVTIGNITVPPNTHPDDIKRIVSDAIVDATAKTNQRVMSQTAAGAYH